MRTKHDVELFDETDEEDDELIDEINAPVFERWMYSTVAASARVFSASKSITWPPIIPSTVPVPRAISCTIFIRDSAEQDNLLSTS